MSLSNVTVSGFRGALAAPFFLLCALSGNAWAGLNAPGFGGASNFSWSGGGDVFGTTRTNCVRSTTGNNTSPATPYVVGAIATQGQGQAQGEFLLTGPGNAVIPFALRHDDLVTPGAEPLLVHGQASVPMTGGTRVGGVNCGNLPGSVNSRFEITVPTGSLYGYPGLSSAPNGRYQGRFQVIYFNLATGQSRTRNLRINVEVDVETVRLSGLSNINFGTLTPGTGNASSDVTFCAHSSTGSYTVTANGAAASDGTNGSFAMNGSATPDQLEYTVRVDDSATFAGGIALNNGVSASSGLNGRVANDNCPGGPNGSVRVGIAAQEITEAANDTYSDTLILRIEPR